MTSPAVQEEGWIEWHGGENPVPGRVVEWRNKHGDTDRFLSDEVYGWEAGHPYQIIAYRVVSAPLGEPEDHGSSSPKSEDTQPGASLTVLVPLATIAACDGEQEHFEAWAKAHRYDMAEHPLHYIFMDPRTDAARMGWNAALAYVRKAAAPDTASPASPVGTKRSGVNP